MKTRSHLLQPVIDETVYVAQNLRTALGKEYHIFSTENVLQYHALCDDFGPMNMSSVFSFIEILDKEIARNSDCKVVYLVEAGKRPLTNAIFLLGAYMILKLNMSSQSVQKRFQWLNDNLVVLFRDATYVAPKFGLSLIDCWQGLERGKMLGWVAMPVDKSGFWGMIHHSQYDRFDDPLNADLHEVVPGKFIAFKGPKDLGLHDYQDDRSGYRRFSPRHYAKIFNVLGATTVIRLNESHYDPRSFEEFGIAHHDLEFADCTAPPVSVVESFFRIIDGAEGCIAVHCKAGLGRTGTLIALYMMRTHGFTAREAMGWLRIMRPGSVIGEQQQYLCTVETFLRGARDSPAPAVAAAGPGAAAVRHVSPPPPDSSSSSSPMEGVASKGPQSEVLAAQVAAGMKRRGAARAAATAGISARDLKDSDEPEGSGLRRLVSVAPPATGGGGRFGAAAKRRWLPELKFASLRAASSSMLRVG